MANKADDSAINLEFLMKKRAAHRGHATRNVNKLEELLNDNDLQHKRKQEEVVTLRDILQVKLETLNELDESILNLVDDMDEELEKAGEVTFYITKNINRASSFIDNFTKTTNKPVSLNRSKTCVELPKISLETFNGDILKWQPFWQSFSLLVHENESISVIDKFLILKNHLSGGALDMINNLYLDLKNYEIAISRLIDRYSNTQKIINEHMKNILNIPCLQTTDIKMFRKFYDTLQNQIYNLETLNVDEKHYERLLIPLLMSKIPEKIKLIIAQKIRSDLWSLTDVMSILKEEVTLREQCFASGFSDLKISEDKTQNSSSSNTFNSQNRTINIAKPFACIYCSGKHYSNQCNVITDVKQRKNIIIEQKRCFNCLNENHLLSECRTQKRCYFCSDKHHQSLCTKRNIKEHQNLMCSAINENIAQTSEIILSTALTTIFSKYTHQSTKCRILFDSGSQQSYITLKAAKQIGAEYVRNLTLNINTFGGCSSSKSSYPLYNLNVATNEGLVNLNLLGIDKICSSLSYQKINRDKILTDSVLKSLKFSDNLTNGVYDVDILIGSNLYNRFVKHRILHSDIGLIATESKLGYILSGALLNTNDSQINTIAMTILSDNIIENFWSLEQQGINENEEVDEFFENSIIFSNKRYSVNLPWQENRAILNNHFELTKRRLNQTVNIAKKNGMLEKCDTLVKYFIEHDILEIVKSDFLKENSNNHYIPHHFVKKESSKTTPLRLVIDAAAKQDKKDISINNCLYTGQNMLHTPVHILLNFRFGFIAMIADIEKAFLQIEINDNDKDSLRILWKKDVNNPSTSNENILVLRYKRLPFGLSCSPYILNKTIKIHLKKYEEKKEDFANVCSKISTSIYSDNVITAFTSADNAIKFYHQSKRIFQDASMNLREWVTNSSIIYNEINASNKPQGHKKLTANYSLPFLDNSESAKIDSLPVLGKSESTMYSLPFLDNSESAKSKHLPVLGKSESTNYSLPFLGNSESDKNFLPVQGELEEKLKSCKVLGLEWKPSIDCFIIKFNQNKYNVVTKRSLLATLAHIYDPLGFISPLLISFKLLIKDLWDSKLAWDIPLSGELKEKSKKLINLMNVMPEIKINRSYFDSNMYKHNSTFSLHIFNDASIKAYASVAYITAHDSCKSQTSFLISKTHVCPSKNITVPRAELLAALTGAKLLQLIKSTFNISFEKIYLWSDAQCVLAWIKNLKNIPSDIFISNRLKLIRKITSINDWYYCKSENNVADLATRFLNFSINDITDIWIRGPEMIINDSFNEYIKENQYMLETKTEQSKTYLTVTCPELINVANIIECSKYSSFRKLINVTAWCLKVFNRNTQFDILIKRSHVIWIKLSQSESFPKELSYLIDNNENKTEIMRSLNLKLDTEGLIRSHGRLNVIENSKFRINVPILLSHTHHISKLIVKDFHINRLHGSARDILTNLRYKYWITKSRKLIRSIINTCIICKRFSKRVYAQPIAPNLPNYRTNCSNAFESTGIDFAGHFWIRKADNVKQKCYVALFTCSTTRAVHLELVNNLSVNEFMMAFRRFVSRRGIPYRMVSDNAKTFHGALKDVNKLINSMKSRDLGKWNEINWEFNVPLAPWWGGWWERLIGTMKSNLKRVLGNSLLSFTELATVVIEIEYIMNTRPLTYIYLDNDQEEVLTPSHLVCGRNLACQPLHDSSQADSHTRYRHVRTLLDTYWKRWSNEYLLMLRERGEKSGQSGVVPKEKDIVLLMQENSPRIKWPLAKITKLYEGRDGLTRSAEVTYSLRGKVKSTRRPIKLLLPLEISET